MKYAFSVVVKKDHEQTLANRLLIKEFKMSLVIAQAHQQRLQIVGIQAFISELLQAILRQKDDQQEDLISQRFLDTLLDNYLDGDFHRKDPALDLSRHDVLLKAEVVFQSKRELRCFAAFLPPLLRMTILAEIAIGTLVNVGTFQLSENFLPINRSSKQALAVTQTVLSALFSLFLAFSAPGMALMSDFGAVVDDSIKKLFDRCRGRAPALREAAALEALPLALSVKIKSCQSLFCLLALNNFVTHVLQDYQQMVSLKDMILMANAEALIPAWGTIIASWLVFGLNQLNDPVQLLSLVMMGFALIRGYFSLGQMGEQGCRYVESDTSQWCAVESDSAALAIDVEPGSPVEAIAQGMGQFSSSSAIGRDSLRDALLLGRDYGLAEGD